jgi:hypothetical protein
MYEYPCDRTHRRHPPEAAHQHEVVSEGDGNTLLTVETCRQQRSVLLRSAAAPRMVSIFRTSDIDILTRKGTIAFGEAPNWQSTPKQNTRQS